MRTLMTNDYIKTISDRFDSEWRGKVRRQCETTGMYLIEWSYCGGLRTDICTWVFDDDVKITKRLKQNKRFCDECNRWEQF